MVPYEKKRGHKSHILHYRRKDERHPKMKVTLAITAAIFAACAVPIEAGQPRDCWACGELLMNFERMGWDNEDPMGQGVGVINMDPEWFKIGGDQIAFNTVFETCKAVYSDCTGERYSISTERLTEMENRFNQFASAIKIEGQKKWRIPTERMQ